MEDYASAESIPEVSEDTGAPEGEGGEVVDQSQSGGDGQTQQATPVEEPWDGSKFALKFRDREIVPESRDKLINLAQLGYSYSTRANDLKTRQQQLDAAEKEIGQYRQLVQAIQKNPSFQQRLFQMYTELNGQGGAQPQGGEGQAHSQLDPAIQQQLQELSSWKSQMEEQQADQELQSEIGSLKQKYQEDWETPDTTGRSLTWQVLNHAYKNNYPTLESAYRDLMFDKVRQDTKAETLRQQQQQQIAAKAKGKVVDGAPAKGNQQPPKGPNLRSMNYDQIAQHVLSQ